MKYVEVSKEDFAAHIAKYQPNVHTNVAQYCEPPLRQYWDTTKKPDDPLALIGAEWLYESYPEDGPALYRKAANKYLIPPTPNAATDGASWDYKVPA